MKFTEKYTLNIITKELPKDKNIYEINLFSSLPNDSSTEHFTYIESLLDTYLSIFINTKNYELIINIKNNIYNYSSNHLLFEVNSINKISYTLNS
jgi:hypothetical protein